MLENKPTGTYYKIKNVQALPAFFMNVTSASDMWMYLSSNGALAAGRQNAAASIFPYETDDRLHLATSTGPKTLVRFKDGRVWEPFNTGYDNPYKISRNLYKRTTGDAVIFEEINECLNLAFSYRWETSEKFGIVRTSEIKNFGEKVIAIEILDGVENLIPHGIQPMMAAMSSCLTDAYKTAERPGDGRLAVYSLTATIGDTVEPVEVLRANTAWFLGDAQAYLLSSRQIGLFAFGECIENEASDAGRKGAFMICQAIDLSPGMDKSWQIILDARLSQREVVALLKKVNNTPLRDLRTELAADIKLGTDELVRIVGTADGLQKTEDSLGCIRQYTSVLFNNMRGGVFLNGYGFDTELFSSFVEMRDKALASRRQDFLEKIKSAGDILELHDLAFADGDPDLNRLSLEFLPLTFSRRHGDPSRPWNQFNIRVKDDDGNRLYHYEGNWRDIFQNWEAMSLSFPGYLAPMIAKFLNASTVDGYNPYRINHEGIDWETPMPNNPLEGTGYWGDHQIVYLNKLLEWLHAYSPDALSKLVKEDIFTYAEIPYEILPYENLLNDGKHTVKFNRDKHNSILERAMEYGTDGKMLMNNAQIYRVGFMEKLIVPILAKLSNFVIGGGIWMNTQRPEWNDANNAIVGNGLSMVTVYQLYRHLTHCVKMIRSMSAEDAITFSTEVKTWFDEISAVVSNHQNLTPRSFLDRAGESFSKYRNKVYADGFSGKESLSVKRIVVFCEDALRVLGKTIEANKRDDGMYHSYNILTLTDGGLDVSHLFLMLEGQTAVLGSGWLNPAEALTLVKAMENSDLMNPLLGQFFLYPMKRLNSFMKRNVIPQELVEKSKLITALLIDGHEGFVLKDAEGEVRFHDTIQQSSDVEKWLTQLRESPEYCKAATESASHLREVYEKVFAHKQFTGRSGIMYKYEGIGCIFWHQNSKFMVSLQESFINATESGANESAELKDAYYRLYKGFGFRKTPQEWGAFPFEPYSHTPYAMPAQQPGMTGQVKEEILNRLAELGVAVDGGVLSFDPVLLRREEFLNVAGVFRYVDVNGEFNEIHLPKGSLAFTVCQVPVVYSLGSENSVKVYENESQESGAGGLTLTKQQSEAVFRRDGSVKKIEVTIQHRK